MAIKLIANYSKKLGIPGFSSHSYSISVETELTTTEGIAAESARLYQLLQSTVDEQIQNTGYIPPDDYGFDSPELRSNVIQHNPASQQNGHANGQPVGNSWQRGPTWKCSDKQKDLILKLVEEHQLNKADVEALSVERFGKGVRALSKLEASGLLDELLDTHGSGQSHDHGKRRDSSAYSGNRKGRAA